MKLDIITNKDNVENNKNEISTDMTKEDIDEIYNNLPENNYNKETCN